MRDRWKGDTVCIAACGPSLTAADVAYAATHTDRFIVVNESWRLHRAADVLYAADCRWWLTRGPSRELFRRERWSTPVGWDGTDRAHPEINWIDTRHGSDIVDAPPICTGMNSAFQAMSLAVIWGASRIVFLGLDMKIGLDGKDHWFGNYQELTSPRAGLPEYAKAFAHAAPQLSARNVKVINASRDTVLDCFERMDLTHALP